MVSSTSATSPYRGDRFLQLVRESRLRSKRHFSGLLFAPAGHRLNVLLLDTQAVLHVAERAFSRASSMNYARDLADTFQSA